MKKYEIKKANGNEPSWAPLAKELAPILIYEDMNQEFPTSIFFDENRNMADNGVSGYWPDGSTYDSVGGTRNGINTGYYTKTNQQKRECARNRRYCKTLKHRYRHSRSCIRIKCNCSN